MAVLPDKDEGTIINVRVFQGESIIDWFCRLCLKGSKGVYDFTLPFEKKIVKSVRVGEGFKMEAGDGIVQGVAEKLNYFTFENEVSKGGLGIGIRSKYLIFSPKEFGVRRLKN